jgi:hypothetical protein
MRQEHFLECVSRRAFTHEKNNKTHRRRLWRVEWERRPVPHKELTYLGQGHEGHRCHVS